MSSSKLIVAVCGATGAQGGSVAQYLLQHGGYTVRALTRSPSGDKAQALKSQGAEIAFCDLANQEQVLNALQGVYAVFGLTNFWEHGDEAEIKQGKILADAAKKCGVTHFIWSSLPHDELKPRHWESKVIIENYLKEIGVPLTCISAAYYFENLWMFLPLKKNADGSYVLDWFFPSDVRLPSFAAEDYGAWVMAALTDPKAWIGKKMHLCVQKLTPRDYSTILSKVSGKQIALKEISIADFDAMRPYVPDDLWLK
ncbi:NmrA-like domain-containing protein 1 [Ceratobasidium sp. 395]|nr:NmrA-like domain-containing protein 1 [Ceratobasidium sp. 395]